jgi:hypothetical protein
MSFFWGLSHSDSQNFACSRRELLGKVSAIGAASLLPQSKVELLVPQKYPLPEFQIGDLVASDWIGDDDEDTPDSGTDFGEILGMRWVPQPDEFSLATNTWVYFVYWTHSTSGDYDWYPCYEGEPSNACDLRLVKRS